jgi:TonB-linked SusC/RagA family outer membrane protein
MAKIRKVLLTAIILFSFTAEYAQNQGIKVEGKVTDRLTGEPVAGASVTVSGTKTGTASGSDGRFSLALKSLPATLTVTFLGYRTQSVAVTDSSAPVLAALDEDEESLDEVVVVGYGAQRRRELTGAITTISTEALSQRAVTVDALLGGAVAGLNVVQTSGQPGAGASVRIRGGNSVYASNEPLYVIDGFIYFSESGATQAGVSGIESSLNPLAAINPADIESVEVLKDASAKAIYGSRGANGVIIVSTRKGARGRNTINYQYTAGIDRSSRRLSLLNAEQFRHVDRDLLHNGSPWTATFEEFYAAQSAAQGRPVDTDWQDAVLQTGVQQTHELSFSGGDERTRYLFSGSYANREGIVIGTGFERYSGRINIDRQLSERFTAGVTASVNRSVQDALNTLTAEDYGAASSSPFKSGITNSLVYALFMPPVLPVRTAAGKYNYYNPFELSELNYYGTAANPVADLNDMIGQTTGTTLLGNFYARYSVPRVEGLTLKFSAGVNVDYITQNFFAPPNTVLGINTDIRGRAAVGNRRTDVSQSEYLATYTRSAGAHYIDLLAGYTAQRTATTFQRTTVTGLETFDDIGFSNVTSRDVRSRSKNATLRSFIARVNYTLLGRYNLTATFRADRSSRFAANFKWGYFPSAGVSWNASDEAFMQGVKSVLSTLKLRATYGTTGNQEIGFDDFIVNLDPARYGNETAAVITNTGNKNLKWETTREYNVGFDAGFLADRLRLTADVYSKQTYDLLLQKFIPLENVYQTFNVGNVVNRGVELTLNAQLVSSAAWNWSATANVARNVNVFAKGYENNSQDIAIPDRASQILRVGEPVGAFYGYIYDGVNHDDGSIILRDLDGDGRTFGDRDDQTVIGSPQPDFIYGFATTLSYRRFDLYISLQGSQGNKVYNKLRRHLTEGNHSRNHITELLDAWTADTPDSDIPAIDKYIVSPNELYSRYIEDGSFLKLRNLTIGYSLPLRLDRAEFKLRIFATAQNLLTLTRYTGYDPEVASGIDTGMYPAARTFLTGVNLTF